MHETVKQKLDGGEDLTTAEKVFALLVQRKPTLAEVLRIETVTHKRLGEFWFEAHRTSSIVHIKIPHDLMSRDTRNLYEIVVNLEDAVNTLRLRQTTSKTLRMRRTQ